MKQTILQVEISHDEGVILLASGIRTAIYESLKSAPGIHDIHVETVIDAEDEEE